MHTFVNTVPMASFVTLRSQMEMNQSGTLCCRVYRSKTIKVDKIRTSRNKGVGSRTFLQKIRLTSRWNPVDTAEPTWVPLRMNIGQARSSPGMAARTLVFTSQIPSLDGCVLKTFNNCCTSRYDMIKQLYDDVPGTVDNRNKLRHVMINPPHGRWAPHACSTDSTNRYSTTE